MRWLGLGAVLVLALGAMGCDGGFSPEDAKARCDQEREARNIGGDTSCVDDDAYDSCISTYEECGDDVTIDDDTCPVLFSCDSDDVEQEEG